MSKVSKLTKAELTVIYTEMRDLVNAGVPDSEAVNRITLDPRFMRTDGKPLKRSQVSGYLQRLKEGALHVKLNSGKNAPPADDDLQNALRAVAEARLSPAFRRRLILFICNKLVS